MNKNIKTKNGAFWWVFRRTKKFFPWIFLSSLISVVSSLILIGLAYVSKMVIDAGTHGHKEQFLAASVSIILFLAFQIILDSVSSMLSVRVSGKYTISLRNHMFSSVLHKKYSEIFGTHSGDILNRFTSDIDAVSSGALNIIPSIFSMLTKIIVGGIALIMQNWKLAIIVLVVGFVFPLVGKMVSKKYKHMHKEVQKSEGMARAFMQESFVNVLVIKTFSSETPILKKLNEYMDKNLSLKLKRNIYSVVVHALLFSFFSFGYYGVLIWGSAQLVSGFSFGTLNYYLQLVSILRNPLQSISSVIPTYYSMLASAERLMDLESIDAEPEPINSNELKAVMDEFSSIDVDNLAFAYDNELVLKNCTFKINKNDITAITGESGSGKSTLFKLILGLYEPTGGSITFNGTKKTDASTRGMFSYVPQTNMLLSGTIRDNLTLCNPNISEDELIKATKTAVIYDTIKELPDGFDTALTERGGGLSEGQLQRISIARALLFDAPILLFDESTSALDEETETALLSNIKKLNEKTVIFITHRNTSLSVCDRIIHVEDKKYSVIK